MTSSVNCFLESVTDLDPTEEFCRIGRDILDSEELTNEVYEVFLAMIPRKAWRGQPWQTRRDFHVSDLALMYRLGPYVLCTPRVAFTRNVDIATDGWPGVSVTATTIDITEPPTRKGTRETAVHLIRPISKFPRTGAAIGHCAKRYKLTEFWSNDDDSYHEGGATYFGIRDDGRLVPVVWGHRAECRVYQAGYAQVWPATLINQWADAKYLWLCETSEDVGFSNPLRMRLGVSAEHIKSLFYARTLPLTDTGRKRPILHWVRAHQRRLAEGIDIDIRPHLRGITEFPLDGLDFRITQPDKAATREMDIPNVTKAWEMYRWN